MRDYGKVAATFWTGHTGRLLRGDRDAQIVALYLVTGPTSNMIGLYHLPIALISNDTGIPLKGASKALRRVCDTGFARFEEQLEYVFVPEMAAYQIGEPLLVNDNRVKGIVTLWHSFRKCPFYIDFHTRYGQSFHLPTPSPLQAPCKPLRSQEQDQEQDQEQKSKSTDTHPTLEQVAAYCRERNNHIDPQRFIDFYTSKGWMIGKNRMKDWRAAVRTWEKNNDNGRSGSGVRSSARVHCEEGRYGTKRPIVAGIPTAIETGSAVAGDATQTPESCGSG